MKNQRVEDQGLNLSSSDQTRRQVDGLLARSLEDLSVPKSVQPFDLCARSGTASPLLYKSQGDYQQAETLYLQSLEINKIVLGENHPNYAVTLENLALFYQSIKPENKEKAAFYFQALFLQFCYARGKTKKKKKNLPEYSQIVC